jgi:hypothetical protein
MKNFKPLLLLLITLGVITSSSAYSQVHCNLLQANNATAAAHAYNAGYWFSVMELPVTRGLSGLGFYSIYKAGKGA